MRQSFTIIEVIIAVVILALVGTALLKNAGMNIGFLSKNERKNSIITLLTVVTNNKNSDYNHLTKTLQDFLQDQYLIDDTELLKILKETKFKYQENIEKISLPSLDDKDQENIINLTFVKLSIQSHKGGDYIYTLELDE